jgi:hypothetical protein
MIDLVGRRGRGDDSVGSRNGNVVGRNDYKFVTFTVNTFYDYFYYDDSLSIKAKYSISFSFEMDGYVPPMMCTINTYTQAAVRFAEEARLSRFHIVKKIIYA